ncbi:MAG: PEP-CTERM sorting domain-containing protein [Leptolyngbya sp. SIOISBB]|nr:PEP-CTERM sorting domain-containing protein [Leptolyngbya sp. SIOISBB]
MMKQLSLVILSALGAATVVPASANAQSLTPESYADRVESYNVGDALVTHNNSSAALGANNWTSDMVGANGWKSNIGVSLGKGGSIALEFTDNYLTGDGNVNSSDLWIFEIGKVPEDLLVDISIDGDAWYRVGLADKQDYRNDSGIGIDIDGLLNTHADLSLETMFSFVRLTDNGTNKYTNGKSGADIDAVAALSSVSKADVVDVPEPGMAVALGAIAFGAFVKRKQQRLH